jgi:hypothetical protein
VREGIRDDRGRKTDRYVQDAHRAAGGPHLSRAEVREGAADDGLFLGPIVFLVMSTIGHWLLEAISIPATAILAMALAVVLVKLLLGVCCRAA